MRKATAQDWGQIIDIGIGHEDIEMCDNLYDIATETGLCAYIYIYISASRGALETLEREGGKK